MSIIDNSLIMIVRMSVSESDANRMICKWKTPSTILFPRSYLSSIRWRSLDIDVDGLHEVIHSLDKLLPRYFVVTIAVIDGEQLVQMLLIDWVMLVHLGPHLFDDLLEFLDVQVSGVVEVVGIEEVHCEFDRFSSGCHDISYQIAYRSLSHFYAKKDRNRFMLSLNNMKTFP